MSINKNLTLVILVVSMFIASCAKEIIYENYIISIFDEKGSKETEIIIYLPIDLTIKYLGDVRCEEVGNPYDLCYVVMSDSTIHIRLDQYLNDAGRNLEGTIVNQSADGVVILRSYGPYETVGTFRLNRKQ